MNSEATNGTTNAGLVGAVTTWRRSVDLLQILIDRAMQVGPLDVSSADHDDFSAALRALYSLEASIFQIEPMELPKPTNPSWSCDG